MNLEYEHHFQCPYCWEMISMVFEYSLDLQQYIEDCEVCCRPIEIAYRTDQESITEFRAINCNE